MERASELIGGRFGAVRCGALRCGEQTQRYKPYYVRRRSLLPPRRERSTYHLARDGHVFAGGNVLQLNHIAVPAVCVV